MIRFFNPGLSYQELRDKILPKIDEVLTKGDLILREDVEEFEKKLADYVGTKYAVGLNSGTDALYLALRGLKIGPGDEVLVPSRTFVATAQVVVQLGATPVYYDLDGDFTFTEKTKAIIPVHIEGAFGADMDELMIETRNRGIFVIEDACQALGAIQNGKKAGSFGDAGCFSFYPAKILGACGDAGALVTNNKDIYEYVKGARNHFKEDARDWGINSRLDNLQAAILNIKMDYLDWSLIKRKKIANQYLKKLKDISGLQLPLDTPGRAWQDFIIRTEQRDALYNYLKEQGVETMKNNYNFPVPKLPQAQKYEDETLRLPCNENVTDEEVIEIINYVKKFYE